MARLISLAAYFLKVRNLSDKTDEVLSEFDDNEDLLDFFDKALTAIKKERSHDPEAQQIMTVTKLHREERCLSGIIETGEYGIESSLLDVDEGKIVHHRSVKQADMLPFYFLIDIPKNADEGLLILQRTGTYGVRKIFAGALSKQFKDQFPEFRLHIDAAVEADEINKYLKGKVQEIRFVRFKLPADLADAYDSGHKEVQGQMELVIKARRGSGLPMNSWLKKVMSKDGPVHGLFAIEDSQTFEYDNVRVRTKAGKSSRILNAADPEKLRSYYDVTDKVKLGKGNHPTFESIHAAAVSLGEKLQSEL